MSFMVLVVELDVADDADGADALAATVRRVTGELPVSPARVWVGIGDLARAVATLGGDG